jgi:hypothetical protein
LGSVVEDDCGVAGAPKVGARIVGVLGVGAWAERVNAPLHSIALIPDEVSDAQAASLPVAGLTALHALRKGGLLLGKKVLVDGASGGVGQFAVQLAAASGARVPELRYGGRDAKHKYRLDFCLIDGTTMERIGFEFSPSSSHATIVDTKNKTQKQINAEVAANFEKEMAKHKAYFKKFGIFVLIYTDSDLADMDGVFNDIKKYLTPVESQTELNFHVLDNFFAK